MIVLDTQILNALLPAASVDKSRPYLNGVFVEDVDGKRIYTATNGRVLFRQIGGIFSDSDPLPEGGILLKLPRKIKAGKNENINFILKDFDTRTAGHIFGSKDNLLFDVLFEKVPNLERIIEETKDYIQENVWVPLAPKYLELICKFFVDVAMPAPLTDKDDKTRAAKWEKRDFRGNLEKLALVMPVRI